MLADAELRASALSVGICGLSSLSVWIHVSVVPGVAVEPFQLWQ